MYIKKSLIRIYIKCYETLTITKQIKKNGLINLKSMKRDKIFLKAQNRARHEKKIPQKKIFILYKLKFLKIFASANFFLFLFLLLSN